ncbi:MAG TPA: glycosyltransferase [Ferruginibacter sp.]|nr:glycosyltransferase [Ferruginibacter sp.]
MRDKHLHIVTHDVPWPADHGGITDLFYKVKALNALGVNIHLHCFTKGRAPQPELDKYCVSVNYYQRKSKINGFSFRLPFIVNSRSAAELIANLQQDDHPILLEGIHCTFPLFKGTLTNRKVVVRLHNTEFAYYRQLAKHETSFLKKLYFLHESGLLKKYERKIANNASFLAVSKKDVDMYRELGAKDIHYLPVFLPYTLAVGKEGKGCYCLYHGNLSVNENEKAATWLLQEVFSKLSIPFVIAGKDPSERLQRFAHEHQHTCLVANPSEKEMQDMIGKAHVHVLPSFNNTGIKLKLLNAVFNGRHCLVNQAAIDGSGLDRCCHIADNPASFQQKLSALYQQDFTEQEIQQRQGLLQSLYNNEVNARKLMTFLW